MERTDLRNWEKWYLILSGRMKSNSTVHKICTSLRIFFTKECVILQLHNVVSEVYTRIDQVIKCCE
jgi:hypothetical protein